MKHAECADCIYVNTLEFSSVSPTKKKCVKSDQIYRKDEQWAKHFFGVISFFLKRNASLKDHKIKTALFEGRGGLQILN